MPDRERSDAYRRIYAVVRRIPVGRVATYGQVARLAGLGGHARMVGYALHALSVDGRPSRGRGSPVPWQRVINARGYISPRADPEAEEEQRLLLLAEGVEVDARGRVNLARFRWARS